MDSTELIKMQTYCYMPKYKSYIDMMGIYDIWYHTSYSSLEVWILFRYAFATGSYVLLRS